MFHVNVRASLTYSRSHSISQVNSRAVMFKFNGNSFVRVDATNGHALKTIEEPDLGSNGLFPIGRACLGYDTVSLPQHHNY